MPPNLGGFFMVRSEERFSRNAETDIVCRLLLEKKNVHGMQSLSAFLYLNIPDLQNDTDDLTLLDLKFLLVVFSILFFFFFHPLLIYFYTLSLHDALPISDGIGSNLSRK